MKRIENKNGKSYLVHLANKIGQGSYATVYTCHVLNEDPGKLYACKNISKD